MLVREAADMYYNNPSQATAVLNADGIVKLESVFTTLISKEYAASRGWEGYFN